MTTVASSSFPSLLPHPLQFVSSLGSCWFYSPLSPNCAIHTNTGCSILLVHGWPEKGHILKENWLPFSQKLKIDKSSLACVGILAQLHCSYWNIFWLKLAQALCMLWQLVQVHLSSQLCLEACYPCSHFLPAKKQSGSILFLDCCCFCIFCFS